MPNLLDIRRRIKSVKNTQQITKAMKMVSAAKLKRAQDRVVTARPFANKMKEVLAGLADRIDEDFHHPLLDAREDQRYLMVLITADKGLCGAFNTNLIKAAQAFIAANPNKDVEILAVGRKGRDFFRRRGAKLSGEYIGLTGKGRVEFSEALEVARDIIKRFTEDKAIDKAFVIYNEFKSVMQQRVVTEQLLPVARQSHEVSPETYPNSLTPSQFVDAVNANARNRLSQVERDQLITDLKSGAKTRAQVLRMLEDSAAGGQPLTRVDYVYEQPPGEIFARLLPRLIETQIFRALLESIASEQGARMTAMDSASKNARELIDSLTLNMNRVRQAAITNEIIEVVSGAAAL